jgi:hypothetical protein
MHSINELVKAFDTPLYNTALDVDNSGWIICKGYGYLITITLIIAGLSNSNWQLLTRRILSSHHASRSAVQRLPGAAHVQISRYCVVEPETC